MGLYKKVALFRRLRSHYVASLFAARKMSAKKKGIIINISSFGGFDYIFNVAYGIGNLALFTKTMTEREKYIQSGVQKCAYFYARTQAYICICVGKAAMDRMANDMAIELVGA